MTTGRADRDSRVHEFGRWGRHQLQARRGHNQQVYPLAPPPHPHAPAHRLHPFRVDHAVVHQVRHVVDGKEGNEEADGLEQHVARQQAAHRTTVRQLFAAVSLPGVLVVLVEAQRTRHDGVLDGARVQRTAGGVRAAGRAEQGGGGGGGSR